MDFQVEKRPCELLEAHKSAELGLPLSAVNAQSVDPDRVAGQHQSGFDIAIGHAQPGKTPTSPSDRRRAAQLGLTPRAGDANVQVQLPDDVGDRPRQQLDH